MKTLLDGVRRYEIFRRPRYLPRFAELAGGQSPPTLFIGCADSRVVPHLIASAEPGDLFVVRNVANLAPPRGQDLGTAAAIGYAVEVLNVEDIVVCGHSSCGGMQALMNDLPGETLQRWLAPARVSLETWREWGPYDDAFAPVDQLSQINARHQLDNLRTYDFVRRRERAGRLRLHAWWFEIATARLLAFEEDAQCFVPAVDALVRRTYRTPRRQRVG